MHLSSKPPRIGSCLSLTASLAVFILVISTSSVLADVYWVTATADTGNGSLRWALESASADAALDSIYFNIPTSDPGYNPGPPSRWVIRPDSTFSVIFNPVVIDGYTQSGAAVNTNAAPGALNGALKIVLNGVNAGGSANGLDLAAPNSAIRGLVINNWGESGIRISNAGPCLVEGNYIGTHVSGTYDLSNKHGIEIIWGQHTIGGITPEARNLISGNSRYGIRCEGAPPSNPVEQTVIRGNLIGTHKNGTSALPNGGGSHAGIYLDYFDDVTIGGTTNAACNVISGNDGDGIYVTHNYTFYPPTGLLVQGNRIGTNGDGSAALANTGHGIHLYSDVGIGSLTDAIIGGGAGGARNIISGNNNDGIYTELMGATIQGNYIGTDISGSNDVGNGRHGIFSQYADSLVIGGSSPGEGNLISGNDKCGISMNSASNFVIQGNYIGTDVTGNLAIGNSEEGIYLNGNNHQIGGTDTGEPNVIAFNALDGVYVYAAYFNPILGNSIHSNGNLGIDLHPNGVTTNDYQDSDFGANYRQNYPVLTSAISDGSTTSIQGSLNSMPNTSFYLEFYHNTSMDPSNYGEGETWIDSISVTTDSNGDASFGIAVTPFLPVDDYVCATATDPDNNTSEFSMNVQVEKARLVVINTFDNGTGSLRDAIESANALAGLDSILFDIPTSDPGYISGPPSYWSIAPNSALPVIGDTVVIDGYTQPGAQENTVAWPGGLDGILKIELDGTNAGGSSHGLEMTAGGCTVRGLAINRFNSQGIRIATNGGNAIGGNYIGTDITGTLYRSNFGIGVGIFSDRNTIGGSNPAERNVISGNGDHGVTLRYAACTDNIIYGNFIGVDVTGISGLGNSGRGIRLYQNPSNNSIGGIGSGEGNIIAYNADNGISVQSGTGNLIRGNSMVSNAGVGIDLADYGVTANDSADVDAGPNDIQNYPVLVSAESGDGWSRVQGTLNSVPNSTFTVDFYSVTTPDPTNYGEGEAWLDSTTVTTDVNGDVAFATIITPAASVGSYITATATNPGESTSEFSECVLVSEHPNPFIVTNTDDDGFGSLRYAITAANDTAGVDTIRFNIPTSDPGYSPGPPAFWSIQPDSNLQAITETVVIDGYSQPGAQPNTVMAPGTSDAVLVIELRGDAGPTGRGIQITGTNDCVITGLVINKFPGVGIKIDGSGTGHRIQGCYIGTDITGTLDRGNTRAGIRAQNQNGNTIGGTAPGDRNVISGNNEDGIRLTNSNGNVVRGNFIGTDMTGTVDRGNSDSGVFVDNSENNTIGGTAPGAGNIISGNGAANAGVFLVGGTTPGNIVQGNYIGVDVTGTASIPNSAFGIRVYYSPYNTIGGSELGAGNVISGNVMQAILFTYDGSHDNVVQGNYIGTNESFATDIGNGLGIDFQHDNPNSNLIGGTAPGEGNFIWYNGWDGIRVMDGNQNAFLCNSIYGNAQLGINLSTDGVTPNDSADVDGGQNLRQNFPLLTSVLGDTDKTIVEGSLNSIPDSTFLLQFFYNTDIDPTGYGEGEVFFADSTVTADTMGDASFAFTFNGVSIPNGSYITATATDPQGNTSEFCEAILVTLMTLDGQIVSTDLQLSWTTISSANEYWVYGANNYAFFPPGILSPHNHRLAILPSGTSTWSSSNGVGDDVNNWTYMVIAVDGSGSEILRTNRFGEFDFLIP